VHDLSNSPISAPLYRVGFHNGWSGDFSALGLLTDADCELLAATDEAITAEINAITEIDEDGLAPLYPPRLLRDTPEHLTYDQHATFVMLLLKGLDRETALAETLSARVAA